MTSHQQTSPEPRTAVTIRRAVNEHGTMTVEVRGSNEQRHVVEFAPGLRELFADLPEGTTVPAEMERLHTRGNCWLLTAVGPTGRGDTRGDRVETARRVVDRERPSLTTR